MGIAENIKILRIKKGLTQYELAKLAGTTQTTISLIESGQRTPRQVTLMKLASVFNVTISDLYNENLFGEGEKCNKQF